MKLQSNRAENSFGRALADYNKHENELDGLVHKYSHPTLLIFSLSCLSIRLLMEIQGEHISRVTENSTTIQNKIKIVFIN